MSLVAPALPAAGGSGEVSISLPLGRRPEGPAGVAGGGGDLRPLPGGDTCGRARPAAAEIPLPDAAGVGARVVLLRGLSFLWSFVEDASFSPRPYSLS